MDTTSTILGPSITLLWPLVGGSLASDWGQIFEIEPAALQQCITKTWRYTTTLLCILKANGHYQHYCRALTFVATCWWFSCLRLGQIFEIDNQLSDKVSQNVEVYNHSPSYILVIPLCICILKANGHYQHHCRALHHTFVATCWWFSCLRLGQIFEIEPAALRQCITKTWRYTTTLLLIYW